MGFLDKLRGFLQGSGSPSGAARADPQALWLHFRCGKCGSVVRVRVHKGNDLSRAEGPGTFLLRKEVMDSKCFQLMSTEIWLDGNYNVVSAEVSGGELISEEEYQAAQSGPIE